ncbi:type II toxin-antitoxin system HicA family toxin [Candidatus Uhrbacteria bacterium]|nr:type II toxin-antitoxin system HicA family toxin [Candidatus Uhrbacteria bacterium]
MPRLTPLKDRELLPLLYRLGFSELRHGATSHKILRHADGRQTIVAMHPGKDISVGTLRKILRDIRVSPEDFMSLL